MLHQSKKAMVQRKNHIQQLRLTQLQLLSLKMLILRLLFMFAEK